MCGARELGVATWNCGSSPGVGVSGAGIATLA